MKAITTLLCSLVILGAASVANARGGQGSTWQNSRYNVDVRMGQSEFNGHETVHLRQLLNQTNPWIPLDQMNLESVTIWAKSMHGKGAVTLEVNARPRDKVRVPGYHFEYSDKHPSTFTPLQLTNNSLMSEGAWQLKTSGNVKITNIRFVLIQKKASRVGPVREVVEIASGRFDKVVGDKNSHYVRINDVKEIRISTTERPILIRQIAVGYANGAVQRLVLNSEVVPGRALKMQLNGRDVRQIELIGTSLEIIGSRAGYVIDAVIEKTR